MTRFNAKKLSVLISLAFAGSLAFAQGPGPGAGTGPSGGPSAGPSAGPGSSAGPGGPGIPSGPGPGPIPGPGVIITPLSPEQQFLYDPIISRTGEVDFTQPGGIPFGSFLVSPEVVLRGTYDSNIYALRGNEVPAQLPSELSDTIVTLIPSVLVKSNWAQHKLNFSAGAELDRYQRYQTENVNDFWLVADGQYDFSPGNNIFGGVSRVGNHEDRGSPNTYYGAEPTVYFTNKAYLGTELRPGSFLMRLGGVREDVRYETPSQMAAPNSSNDDRNVVLTSFGGRFGYAITPAFTPFLQYSTDKRHYRRNTDDLGFQRSSDGYRAAIGATFKPAPTLEGEAFIGRMKQSYDDTRFETLYRPYFGGHLTWTPTYGTRLTGYVDRSLQETTLANSSSYTTTTVGLGVEHAVTQNLLATLGIAYSSEDFQGTGRLDKVLDAGAGIKYYMTPTTYLGADYRLIGRDSNLLAAGYHREQLMFSLGYTPGRRSLASAGGSGDGLMIRAVEASKWHGEITPKLAYFSYAGGATDTTHYLERYDYLESTGGGNTRSGGIIDLDLNLLYAGADYDVLLERDAFGANNDRMNLRARSASIRLKANRSRFTTASNGIEYLYNPDVVAGGTDPNYLTSATESQHVATFNNDSPGTTALEVTRSTYGSSLLIKPAAFGEHAAAELSFDGYTRKGEQITNYVLKTGDLTGVVTREANQWRGYSKSIDEQSRQLAFNMTFAPLENSQADYEFRVSRFENYATPVTLASVSQWTGGALPLNPAANASSSLHFVPDSTMFTNNLRWSSTFGDTAVVGAGWSMSRLQQDSYSDTETNLGYTSGRHDTSTAYLTGKVNISQTVGLDGFYRYYQRDNRSSYPVAGFYEPVSLSNDPLMVAPRLNAETTRTYGVEAKLYPKVLATNWSAGWTSIDTHRDFTNGASPNYLPPEMSLYRDSSNSDEVFIKAVIRPAAGWMLRITPSYLWGNSSGLMSEPEKRIRVKSLLSYTPPDMSQLQVTGYYNYSKSQNGNLGFSDFNAALSTFGPTQAQKADNAIQSAGVDANFVPSEDITGRAGYAWNQTNFRTYYYSTNRLRYHFTNPPIIGVNFLQLDEPNYKVDTHTLTLGLDRKMGLYLFSGNYVLTRSKGLNSSDLAGQILPLVDDKVDNDLHSLTLGMEYSYRKDILLRGAYSYDYYKDYVYDTLSGGRNVLTFGLSYKLH